MKRDGIGPPIIAIVAALFLIVIAIGAGLEGRFSFAGPIWNPPGVGIGPIPSATSTPPPPPASSTPLPRHIDAGVTFSWVPIAIVMAILLLTVIFVIVLLWVRNHPRRGAKRRFATVDVDGEDLLLEPESLPDLPTLQRGLSRASEALETERIPRDAIVRAWVGLQEAAEDSGVRRRPAETPTEFTSRVFSSVDADRGAAETLLALYLRVRFGTSGADEHDLQAARDAVDALRRSWPEEGTQ